MFRFVCVHYTFSSVWVAWWPPYGRWLPARLAICSHCILSICNIYLFPVLVLRAGFAFRLSSSCSVLFYYFNLNTKIQLSVIQNRRYRLSNFRQTEKDFDRYPLQRKTRTLTFKLV